MSTLPKTELEMDNDSYNRSIEQPMQIYNIYDNTYSVYNEFTNSQYIVEVDENLNPISCTCPHYQYRLQNLNIYCKHMYAVINYLQNCY